MNFYLFHLCDVRQHVSVWGARRGPRVWQVEERQLTDYQCLCWFLPHLFNSSLCSLRHQDTGNKPPQAAHVDSCSPLSCQQEGLDTGCRGHVCPQPKSTLLQNWECGLCFIMTCYLPEPHIVTVSETTASVFHSIPACIFAHWRRPASHAGPMTLFVPCSLSHPSILSDKTKRQNH